jgi:hypothetical protein
MPEQSNDQDRAAQQTQSDWNNPGLKNQGNARPNREPAKGVEPVSTEEGPGAAPEGGTKGGDQSGAAAEQDQQGLGQGGSAPLGGQQGAGPDRQRDGQTGQQADKGKER